MCGGTYAYMCGGTFSCVWVDSFKCVARLIRVWKIKHLNVWWDSFVCVNRPICICGGTYSCCETTLLYAWRELFCETTYLWQHLNKRIRLIHLLPFICVAGIIRMCEMTDLYLWRDLFTFSHLYAWRDLCKCLILKCDMTHFRVRHDSFIRLFICVTGLVRACEMTQLYI